MGLHNHIAVKGGTCAISARAREAEPWQKSVGEPLTVAIGQRIDAGCSGFLRLRRPRASAKNRTTLIVPVCGIWMPGSICFQVASKWLPSGFRFLLRGSLFGSHLEATWKPLGSLLGGLSFKWL
jgi:hypothetical protein